MRYRPMILPNMIFIVLLSAIGKEITAQELVEDTTNYQYLRNRIKEQTFYIKMDSGNIEYYLRRGQYELFIHDYEAAVRDNSKAIQLDSLNSDAFCNRGMAKYELKDFNGALADLKSYRTEP
jgi:hypothetical protein